MAELDPTPTEQLPTGEEQRRDLSKRLGDMIVDIRNRRRPWEQEQLNNHAAWRAVRIEARAGYRSDLYKHYIPVARRAIERIVTRAVQTLYPQPSFFEVYPGSEFDLSAGRQADAVRAHLLYLLTARIKTRKLLTQLVRSLLIYQRAITKSAVQVVEAPVRWAGQAGMVRQVWPTVRAVDPLALYVWPETVTDLDDAVMVFEDLMLPWDEYQRAAARGVAKPLRREDLGAPEWPHYHITRLSHVGMGDPSSTSGSQADEPAGGRPVVAGRPQLFVSLTEVWFRSQGRWMMAWLVWNASKDREGAPLLVRIHQSPYPMPPYRLAIARPLPGEHYTSGAMDDLEQLQQLFNDQVNQGEESRAIAALPPVGVDTNVFPRKDLLQWGPRKIWVGQGDISKGMHAMELPDTSASSVRAAQLTLALINSIGGAGGIQEGQPARGLPRAGFAVTSLINLGMADVKDVAEILEQELLSPMLSDLHRLTVAFVPRSQLIRVPGTEAYPPRTMSVEDLYGDWVFRWVGSQQAAANEIRSQKLLAGAQLLAKVEPLLQQKGYTVNWPDLVKMVWRDGMGERGLHNIVVPIPPGTAVAPGAQQGGGGQQGGSPGGEEDIGRMIAAMLSGGQAEG